MFHKFNTIPARVRFCGAVGAAGLVVSFAMRWMTPDLHQFLPQGAVFHTAAFFGAALAGLIAWDAFGRRGARGIVLAGIAAVVITAAGAEAGAQIAAGLMGEMVFAGPFGLGLLTLIISLHGPASPLIWGASMMLLQVYARRLRDTAPVAIPA